jgi:predicted nuclease of predicted toxin-antitoxin system
VKFLIDANLPPRLCAWLKSRRHDSDHLFDLNLLTATDTEIWGRATAQNLIIVSKDVDFLRSSAAFRFSTAGRARGGRQL